MMVDEVEGGDTSDINNSNCMTSYIVGDKHYDPT